MWRLTKMHEFTPSSVDEFLTQELLNNINVTLPNNEGEYLSVEDFICASDETQDIADQVLTSVEQLISRHTLPNVQGE